jgi:hypothetical protein
MVNEANKTPMSCSREVTPSQNSRGAPQAARRNILQQKDYSFLCLFYKTNMSRSALKHKVGGQEEAVSSSLSSPVLSPLPIDLTSTPMDSNLNQCNTPAAPKRKRAKFCRRLFIEDEAKENVRGSATDDEDDDGLIMLTQKPRSGANKEEEEDEREPSPSLLSGWGGDSKPRARPPPRATRRCAKGKTSRVKDEKEEEEKDDEAQQQAKEEEEEVDCDVFIAPPLSPLNMKALGKKALKLSSEPVIAYKLSDREIHAVVSDYNGKRGLDVRQYEVNSLGQVFPKPIGLRLDCDKTRSFIEQIREIREAAYQKQRRRFHLGGHNYVSIDQEKIDVRRFYYDTEDDKVKHGRKGIILSRYELDNLFRVMNQVDSPDVWPELNERKESCMNSHYSEENQMGLAMCPSCSPPGATPGFED